VRPPSADVKRRRCRAPPDKRRDLLDRGFIGRGCLNRRQMRAYMQRLLNFTRFDPPDFTKIDPLDFT
jgi:hypothetical protein